uniref:Ycf54 n=1 Tax=Polysiphonia sertularioides TaxID=945028 RepID=A0A1Z1M9F8_9FLOR|nr:hypothetical protein [Polysiphonia sertularioides]ARW62405.1 hypothetical protein [Polysiphonia sertularioides]
MHNYHFVVASQSFLFNQEPIEEILRERTNYYKNSNKEIDFWFVLNSSFSDDLKKSMKLNIPDKPLAAIVSLDKQFIQWLKLRIVFVQTGTFSSKSLFLPESI